MILPKWSDECKAWFDSKIVHRHFLFQNVIRCSFPFLIMFSKGNDKKLQEWTFAKINPWKGDELKIVSVFNEKFYEKKLQTADRNWERLVKWLQYNSALQIKTSFESLKYNMHETHGLKISNDLHGRVCTLLKTWLFFTMFKALVKRTGK